MDARLKVSPERDRPHISMRPEQEQVQIQASHSLVMILDKEVSMGVQTKLAVPPIHPMCDTPLEGRSKLLMKKKQLEHQYPI